MKTGLMIASLAAALLTATSAFAQAPAGAGNSPQQTAPAASGGMSPGPGMGPGAGMGPGKGMGAGMQRPADCSRAASPQLCEERRAARQKAMESCKDKVGPARRECMRNAMPPVDCSKSANPALCEQHQKAREACKDKVGPAHRQCLHEQLAPAKP